MKVKKIESRYIRIGLVAFVVIAASILFFFAFYQINKVTAFVETVTEILKPFIYGLVMAYLLGPLYNATFKGAEKIKALHFGKKDRSKLYGRIIASTVSIVVMFTVITGLLWMVIPGLVDSVIGIFKMLPSKVNEISIWLGDASKKIPETAGPLGGIFDSIVHNAQNWLEHTIIPGSQAVITVVSDSVFGFLAGIKNFAIGVIICVFFLNSKEIFAGHSRKIVFAVTDEERAYKFLYGAHFVNKTFGKFINGKLIDSLIIGVLCFLFMSVVNWPYAMLISVIVGVTNIIPFFGPFIGAIPSALLILMVDPWICLYFLIFILVLQQLDGNIIGPKILGGSTGLPSFWVMFAILVGGGLFGFVGMVIGIPVFACIYTYTAYSVNKKLDKKGLTTNLNIYKRMDEVLDKEMAKDLVSKNIEKIEKDEAIERQSELAKLHNKDKKQHKEKHKKEEN